MHWLPARSRTPVPWKNGGGVTFEIIRSPASGSLDDFDWRVSTAKVDRAGPFSRFDGVERVLAVLEGRLLLTLGEDPAVSINVGDLPLAFSGEAAVQGKPLLPVIDLNLMYRRDRCSGRMLAIGKGERALDFLGVEASAIVFCANEPMLLQIGDAHSVFGRHDACLLQNAEATRARVQTGINGAGYLILIEPVLGD